MKKFNVKNCKPTAYQVILRPLSDSERKSKAGLILLETNEDKYVQAEVVSVGYKVNAEREQHGADPFKVGDRVLCLKSARNSTFFDVDGEQKEFFITHFELGIHAVL